MQIIDPTRLEDELTTAETSRWPKGGLIQSIRLCLSTGILPFRLIGAHDALSARLGAEAGFDCIWASGLEISASHAVPDAGQLPRGEIVERVREMTNAVSCPVLVDTDNGFDDTAQTVKLFEAVGAAGIVLEDKKPPKVNSLLEAEHKLEDVQEFCGKLQLATSSRLNKRFAIVARIEALVAGYGPEVAVERGEVYVKAGADALVIHSNRPSGFDIVETLTRLNVPVPVGVIPTRFYRWNAEALRKAGTSFVIYANHGVRAKIQALRKIFKEIYTSGSSESIESDIATVEDVFDLQAPRNK